MIAGGMFQLAEPTYAASPAAGSDITNTATASYEDPNAPGSAINTVSNTVTVKVAKVAGILVTEVGFTQPNATDAFKPNETVYSNFNVTNTGNDGVQFKVPNLATVGGNAQFTRVEYFNGTAWVPATAPGGTDSQIIAAGGVLQVRVVLIINGNANAGNPIVTTLGNTSTAGLINVARGVGSETVDPKDIYTVDVLSPTTNVVLGGTAANGTREASAQQTINVNATRQAFASVDLTHTTPVPVGATNTDNITYNIAVTVPTVDPNGTGKLATDLAPTTIKLATTADAITGADTPRVLISQTLPNGETLVTGNLPTAPTGWTPVYATTLDSPGTPTVWSTVPPTNLATVKQVGFIYEPTGAPTTGAVLPATITPYTGFAVPVITADLGTYITTATIAGTTTTAAGVADLTKPVTVTPDSDTLTTVRGATISTIYNGPENKPQATGPNNNNNLDFTNKSTTISVADAVRDAVTGVLKPTSAPSPVVTFNNTVANSTNVAGNVYVLPAPPAIATALPNGTIVTIKNINGTDTRTYTYNNGAFTTTNTALPPLTLPIAGNGTVSYAVDVTLPAGVAQLTGYPVPVTAFTSATAPANGDTTPPSGALANTTIDRVYTGYIDLIKEARLLDVITEQGIDDVTKPYVKGTAANALQAVPGKFIQYRIRAYNVSEDLAGGSVDSKLLDAGTVKMVEDGTAAPNNWASTTTHAPDSAKTFLDTTLLSPSTITFDQGTKLNSQPAVSRYDVNLGTTVIAPTQTGSFEFVRQVNVPAQTPGTPTTTTTIQ
jgi:hypothetical protein